MYWLGWLAVVGADRQTHRANVLDQIVLRRVSVSRSKNSARQRAHVIDGLMLSFIMKESSLRYECASGEAERMIFFPQEMEEK